LRLTLAKLFVTGKVVIIGHSLGSLVAIEAQHRYGYLAKALILCSPPLYRSEDHKAFFHPERALRKLYRVIHARPDDFLALSAFAIKYKLVNKSFFVTRANMEPFVNALQAAIVNQTAMDDVVKLRVPVEIIHGIVDPIVIAKNLRTVAKQSEYIHVTDIPAGHEIGTVYDIPLVATINRVVDNL
jgi:pimeloyl-ACP methyl ester carboxylesterase